MHLWTVRIIRFRSSRHNKTCPRLGTFEALEHLALGIHGKRALWRALNVVAKTDGRLGGVDFPSLAEKAQEQHDLVDQMRLELAAQVFNPKTHAAR